MEYGVVRGRQERGRGKRAVLGEGQTGRKQQQDKHSDKYNWCPGRDLNPHFPCEKKDFKSFASADFATRASGFFHSKREKWTRRDTM